MLKGRARGRRRRPHQSPPGGPQCTPARRRDPRRRPAAHPGRCRLGQDAGAHPPDRVARADRARARGRASGHHLHQQGRAGDARARRAAARALHPRHVGHDLPRGVRAAAARRGAAPGLHPPVHDLRRGRLPAPHQALHRRARHRPQALHAGGDAAPDLRREEQAARRRGLPPAGRIVLRGHRRRGLRALRARPAPHERDGLRRPPGAHRQRPRALPRGPRPLRRRVPPRPRRRVPGHQPRPVPPAAAAGRRAPQPGGRR